MPKYQVKKTDENQQAIMDALRKAGYVVLDLHTVGKGCPDLLVGSKKGNVLIECKMPGKDLNDEELHFFETWSGPRVVIFYASEAVEIVRNALERRNDG